MPSIVDHPAGKTTKLILLGDTGSGKTGSLCSLAAAGYNLRILDLDNGIDIIRNLLTAQGSAYKIPREDLATRVMYRTLTEPQKAVGGQLRPVRAQVWSQMAQMLENWKWTTPEGEVEDLGKVTDWTDKDVLVIDSLTRAAQAAMNFHQQLNGRLGQDGVSNEWRRDIGAAQAHIKHLMDLLSDASVKCNVVLIAHVQYVADQGSAPAMPGEASDQQHGHPLAIGRALSPLIPTWFNNVLLAKADDVGNRKLWTKPQAKVMTKSSNPKAVAASYSVETGLAEYFAAARGESK